MVSLAILQLQASLATITELQIHAEDPDKYQVYEKNKAKLLAQLKLVQHNTQAPFRNGNGNSVQNRGKESLPNQLPDPAHSLRDGSRMPSAPLRGGYAVLEPALSR